jgi:DNA-binding SARP family transcriptional activator
MEDENILQVTMFGDFAMYYNGTQLKLERTNTTKAMQALQLLLYYDADGVGRSTLLDLLYGDDNALEPANNLKVTISNLRRLLLHAGLPGETSIYYHGGSYFWRSSVPMCVDVKEFGQAIERADAADSPQKKIKALQEACDLYKGAFLPHLQSSSWAVSAGATYREQYFRCVRGLTKLLGAENRWEQLLSVATAAAGLYGIEDFQLTRIDCLMRLERYTEAKQVYEETVRGLRDDFDLGPSEALLQRCRELDGMLYDRTDTIQDFQHTLAEAEQERGAYYCAYPGFIDAYRVVSRMLERNGQSAYLVLCWLTDCRGHEVSERGKLTDAVPKVSDAIRKALRRGDLYTQPARDRFLILLVGTNRENCSVVTARIQEIYHKASARGVSLSFKMAPVGDALEQEMFRQKPTWEAPLAK